MLLGKAQGLQPGEQHPFPWYPPVCSSLSDIPESVRSYDHLSSIKERAKLNARIADPSMKFVSVAFTVYIYVCFIIIF